MRADTPAPARGSTPEQVRECYLRALLDSDLTAARTVLDEAIASGMPVPRIYLDVLQPTLYEVGRRWSHAEISVAHEHLATAATQSAMARLAESLGEGPRRVRSGSAIVACVSEELHAVGGRMVADFLEADGWRVMFLGQLTPGDDLAALAAGNGAQLVALSAALPARVPQVAEVCASAARPRSGPVRARRRAGVRRLGRAGAAHRGRRLRGRRGGRRRGRARALPRRSMIREQLDRYTWESAAMLAAVLAPDGTVLDANPALERLAGGPLAGGALDALIQAAQRDAFAGRLAAAGAAWSAATFALATGGAETATDRRVWLRRTGDAILFVAEPAVGEQERLVEKVLELNDELVVAHRELVRQREELRRSAGRIRNLEAISAAGLLNLRLEDMLPAVLRIIAEAVGSERAVLLLVDDDGDELVARAAIGVSGVELDEIRVPIGAGVAGRIAAENRPRVVPDLAVVDVHGDDLRASSRSMAGVPLTLDGEVIGVLHVSSDEVDRFGEDDLGLLVPAAERAALAIGRARIVERERRIAETLQRALLPDVLPSLEGLELAATFLPGAGVEVGGDWYDALPLPSGELAVVVGDVAGKGLRAATLMGELRAGLRAYAIEGGGPMDTLIRLNRLALRSFHMATVVVMHVAADLGSVTYGSAGHLPPLRIAADGSARFLEGGASTPLLALREDVEDGTAALEPGDRIVLYTDGLVERRREPIDESLERLRTTAEGFEGTVEALCDHLIDALRPPAGAVMDDTAVVALRRRA